LIDSICEYFKVIPGEKGLEMLTYTYLFIAADITNPPLRSKYEGRSVPPPAIEILKGLREIIITVEYKHQGCKLWFIYAKAKKLGETIE
jgi:hypothetical protein